MNVCFLGICLVAFMFIYTYFVYIFTKYLLQLVALDIKQCACKTSKSTYQFYEIIIYLI